MEETLNKAAEEEADRNTNANRYERTPRNAEYSGGAQRAEVADNIGQVDLQCRSCAHLPFETAIIERTNGGKSSVEEALIEMLLAGVSCGKFAVVPAQMGTRRSCWYAPGCGIYRPRSGVRNDI